MINKSTEKKASPWPGWIIMLGLGLLVAGTICPGSVSHAQQKVKPEVVLPDFYPDGFDGFGRIERIGKGEIVIDEELWKLAPGVEYYSPRGPAPLGFPPDEGALVGYELNEEKQIVSIWLIEE